MPLPRREDVVVNKPGGLCCYGLRQNSRHRARAAVDVEWTR
jgi:hypothetical protein